MKRKEIMHVLAQEMYLPFLTDGKNIQGLRLQSTLLVAMTTTPDQPCGEAFRIGSTKVDGTSQPIYRIRVKADNRRFLVTLAPLFVLLDGCFLDYTHWSTALADCPARPMVDTDRKDA